MLKKLSLILVICSMQQIQANWIHDAIYSGDVAQIADMIAHTAITKDELNRYCDFADQVVAIRRDNFSNTTLEAECNCAQSIALSGLMGAIVACAIINEKDWSLWFYLKAGFLTGASTALGVLVANGFKESSRKNAYVNALHIQKLLHDYEEVFVAQFAVAASNDK